MRKTWKLFVHWFIGPLGKEIQPTDALKSRYLVAFSPLNPRCQGDFERKGGTLYE